MFIAGRALAVVCDKHTGVLVWRVARHAVFDAARTAIRRVEVAPRYVSEFQDDAMRRVLFPGGVEYMI